MPRIIVASTNPVKIKATQLGFESMFPGGGENEDKNKGKGKNTDKNKNETKFKIEGLATPSGVAAQPLSLSETIQGALNRVEQASQKIPAADFWVGIEGGIQENPLSHEMMTFAWVTIKSRSGQIGQGSTGSFSLPPKMQKLIQQGLELGKVDDLVFGRHNSKHREGAVGLLTQNILTRTTFYVPGVILALIPFKNQKLWKE